MLDTILDPSDKSMNQTDQNPALVDLIFYWQNVQNPEGKKGILVF